MITNGDQMITNGDQMIINGDQMFQFSKGKPIFITAQSVTEGTGLYREKITKG